MASGSRGAVIWCRHAPAGEVSVSCQSPGEGLSGQQHQHHDYGQQYAYSRLSSEFCRKPRLRRRPCRWLGGRLPAAIRTMTGPDSYKVKAGDTLYSIALNHGPGLP